MTTLAGQVAGTINNTRLLEESQRRVQSEQTLNKLSARFSRSLDVDSLMQTVVRELGKLPSVSKVSLHIASPEVEEYFNLNGEQLGTEHADK